MNYLVKNGNEFLMLSVVTGFPQLPDGMEVIGPENLHNPNNIDLAIAKLEEIEVEGEQQILIQEAQPEVPYQAEIPAQPEKWVKGEEEVFVDPEDETYTYVPMVLGQPEVPYQAAVPAIYETVPAVMRQVLVVDTAKQAAKQVSDTKAYVSNSIASAIKFGQEIVVDFSSDNVLLGITQEDMTGSVLDRMAGILTACQSGSLKEAIKRAKALPAEAKDAKYVTDERLLAFVNKIEIYLEVPLSTTL